MFGLILQGNDYASSNFSRQTVDPNEWTNWNEFCLFLYTCYVPVRSFYSHYTDHVLTNDSGLIFVLVIT